MWGDNILTFYANTKYLYNLLEVTWKTLLETDLDLLLHFKPNLTRLGTA